MRLYYSGRNEVHHTYQGRLTGRSTGTKTPHIMTKRKNRSATSQSTWGKTIDGQPVKVRSDEMIPTRLSISSAPKAAYNHGNLLPLQNITQELSIQATLEEFLTEIETDTLLSLVYNRILRPTAMSNVQSWYEGSSLWLNNNKLPLSGQRISEFLSNIGQSNIPEEFMERFAAHIRTKRDSSL